MILEPERLLQRGSYSHDQLAEALMDAYYAPIHHIAYSILRDVGAADEATQETFIKALRNFDHYEAGTNLKGWLKTIVVNCCRDKLRKRKRRERWHNAWAGLRRLTQPTDSPERRAAEAETNERLWAAVDGLSEKHSIPIVLRHVHNLPVREIAEIMELPEGIVHSRLHYACKKLKKTLGPTENIWQSAQSDE